MPKPGRKYPGVNFVTGFWWLVAGYWSLVSGGWLLVSGFWSLGVVKVSRHYQGTWTFRILPARRPTLLAFRYRFAIATGYPIFDA